MEGKEIVVGPPLTVAGVTLIPVTKVSLGCQRASGGLYFFGAKQPVAVVVVSRSAKRAFRISGEEFSLEQLIKEAPGIKEILEELTPG